MPRRRGCRVTRGPSFKSWAANMGCMLELGCGYVGGMVGVIALMLVACLMIFYIERRMRRRYPAPGELRLGSVLLQFFVFTVDVPHCQGTNLRAEAPYGFEPTDLLSEQERYHLRRFKVLKPSSAVDKSDATQMLLRTTAEQTAADRTLESRNLFALAIGTQIEVANTKTWGWQGSLNHQHAWFHHLSKEKVTAIVFMRAS
eukprot:760471-Hanusia_phi.AAC.4